MPVLALRPELQRISATENCSILQCTVTFTVAVLLAMLGSGEYSVAVPLSVITDPAGAVTFTVSRTVHVVFGAMLLFS